MRYKDLPTWPGWLAVVFCAVYSETKNDQVQNLMPVASLCNV
jgi:hypothetical protein